MNKINQTVKIKYWHGNFKRKSKIVLFGIESGIHLCVNPYGPDMKNKLREELGIYKTGYKKRLEISVILSLIFFVCLFYLFPVFISGFFILPDVPVPQITVIDIPKTVQHYAKRPPQPIQPAIPVPSEEMSIMDDIEIETENIRDLIDPSRVFNPDELEGLPYMPRQILEVLPEKTTDNLRGEIILSLHIDKNGKVKAHKVVKNTTGSEACLKSVINAAYHSRWQPVVIDANIYEYWIYKSYMFK